MAADLDTFNPFDPNTLQCPFPHYEQMRDERPVMFIESLYLLALQTVLPYTNINDSLPEQQLRLIKREHLSSGIYFEVDLSLSLKW